MYVPYMMMKSGTVSLFLFNSITNYETKNNLGDDKNGRNPRGRTCLKLCKT